MRYTRIIKDENAVPFREYIENLEQRRKEDLERIENRRQEDLARYEKDRKEDLERYKEHVTTIEKRRTEDFEKFQTEISTHRTEILNAMKDLQKTFRNNIFIPFVIALLVIFVGLLLPLGLSNWQNFITATLAQPSPITNITTE
ncbi:MAG: hypothetical protein FWG64_11215 [Firmicutes bacterium]|nr:hypothetical protein [Bacillota bacterium]